MKKTKDFDVIIVGGSYSGLAAGMALGRAMKNVLIIDSGRPCNMQTPHSHNFITQDGKRPAEIAALAREQVEKYGTVSFLNGLAVSGVASEGGFEIHTASGEAFHAKKLVFATGIRDMLPDLDGIGACWGVSVLHCPYCHGYEARNVRTGVLGNGEKGFEFIGLISNWTKDLTLFTNGKSDLTPTQRAKLDDHLIKLVETPIKQLEHVNGHLQKVIFKDGTSASISALYAPSPFAQHCDIPESLGCEFTEEGYIKTDFMQRTSLPGVYACGDNAARTRTVASAVSMGTTAGMMVNKELVLEQF